MAVGCLDFYGWELDHINVYTGGVGVTGSPSVGDGTLTLAQTSPQERVDFHPVSPVLHHGDSDITVRTIRYLVLAFTVDDWGGATDDEALIARIATTVAEFFIYLVKTAGDEWLLRIRTGGDEHSGTNEHTFGALHTVRIKTDGANVVGEVDGDTDFTKAETGKMTRLNVLQAPDADDGAKTIVFQPVLLTSGDTGADRPSTTLTIFEFHPRSGTPHHDEFITVVGPTNGYEATDDYETGDQDDIASHHESSDLAVDVVQLQTYLTDNVVATNPRLLISYMGYEVSAADKETQIWNIICDGTNEKFGTVESIDDGDWHRRRMIWGRAPDNGNWTDDDFDNLQIGIRTNFLGEDAQLARVTAVAAEGIDFDTDPEPIVTGSLVERGFERGVARGVLRGVV